MATKKSILFSSLELLKSMGAQGVESPIASQAGQRSGLPVPSPELRGLRTLKELLGRVAPYMSYMSLAEQDLLVHAIQVHNYVPPDANAAIGRIFQLRNNDRGRAPTNVGVSDQDIAEIVVKEAASVCSCGMESPTTKSLELVSATQLLKSKYLHKKRGKNGKWVYTYKESEGRAPKGHVAPPKGSDLYTPAGKKVSKEQERQERAERQGRRAGRGVSYSDLSDSFGFTEAQANALGKKGISANHIQKVINKADNEKLQDSDNLYRYLMGNMSQAEQSSGKHAHERELNKPSSR